MNVKLLRSLQVFVRVAEEGNMSTAAKSLQMTVSAISQQLRKLEQDVGLSLLNRNTRNISLTEAGRIYYQTSLELIEIAQKAQAAIEQLQSEPAGELSVIAPEGFGGGLLSEPLRSLITQFPKMRVRLTVTDEPTDIIASGMDLTIGFSAMPDANYESYPLARWQRILCVSGDHPLVGKKNLIPEDLALHTHVAHKLLREYDLSQHGKAVYSLPRSRVEVNSMQTLIQLTKDNLGYAVLPEPEIRHCLEDGSLVQLFKDYSLPDYSVFAITPKQDVIPPKTRAAVASLQSWFSEI